jgi:hypothetical protein
MSEAHKADADMPPNRDDRVASEANVCFVISPFGGYFDQYYEIVFRPAITAVGLESRRADDVFMSGDIVGNIWALVTSCRLMLADLTGKKS